MRVKLKQCTILARGDTVKRLANYNTKQREAILNYITSLDGAHVTAAQIVEYFEAADFSVGRTTVYRHLERLTDNGVLRRYTADGIAGAFYQFVDNIENCHSHLHLKCENCGLLSHLVCEALDEFDQHLYDEHSFRVNNMKTVLYGKCGDCQEKT